MDEEMGSGAIAIAFRLF